MTHTFRGLRYTVAFTPHRVWAGSCVLEDTLKPLPRKHRRLTVDSRLDGLRRFTVIIHESLHACSPDTSEAAVTQTAADIARLLWRLGYRLDPDAEPHR